MFVRIIVIWCISASLRTINGENNVEGKYSDGGRDFEIFVYKKIKALEHLMKEKDDQIGELESRLTNQDTEITKLKQTVTSLKRDILQKDDEFERLKQKFMFMDTPLQTSVSQLSENYVTPLRQNVNVFVPDNGTGLHHDGRTDYHQNGERSNPVVHQIADINTTPRIQHKRVAEVPKQRTAFYVVLANDAHFNAHEKIVYNQKNLDHGNGYNPTSGVYTIPETGTYVFTWTTIADVEQWFQTVLTANGSHMAYSWLEPEDVHDRHQITSVAIIHLIQGDYVDIRIGNTRGNQMVRILSDANYAYSTFSGWKLD